MEVGIHRKNLPDGRVQITVADPVTGRLAGPPITELNKAQADSTCEKIATIFRNSGSQVNSTEE